MRPVSPRNSVAAQELAPRFTGGPAAAGGPGARARAAAARAAAVGGRDSAAAGSTRPTLEGILGRVPARGVRGLAALLSPPPGPCPSGVAQLAATLRQSARRARASGGAADPLSRAAASDPGAAALRAAVEREQRLGRVLEELGALQDQVTASMTAVASG